MKSGQIIGPKSECQRYVCGIATVGDKDPTDPQAVVAGVEGVPAVAEIHFHPGREITGCVRQRQTDVAHIAVAVARWNVQAAAERDRQMRVVATDTPLLFKDVEGCPGRSCMLVSERNPIVNEIADRLHPSPTRRYMSK